MRAAAVIFLVLGLAGCATSVPVPDRPVPDRATAAAAWARVLQTRVDDRGRVDFAGLRQDHADLDTYLAWVAEVGPRSYPERFPGLESQLAYHINTYNALAMKNVIASGASGRLGQLDRIRFFYLTDFQVAGRPISLFAYENDVIRPLGDPRIHFALNCMAVSCPRLPREPFEAATLDRRLDEEAVAFFGEPRNLTIDRKGDEIVLSKILDFYTEDFLAKAPTLHVYVNRFIEKPIPPTYDISFRPYDWTINAQPGRGLDGS